MDVGLPLYDNAIAVHTIAEQLNITDEELMVHVYTLQNLYYIKFAGRAHDMLILTFNGRSTVVPQ